MPYIVASRCSTWPISPRQVQISPRQMQISLSSPRQISPVQVISPCPRAAAAAAAVAVGRGGGGGGGRYQLRFERVPLAAALDEATWQGLHKRYWRFPCYLAPSVASRADARRSKAWGAVPGHPTEKKQKILAKG